MPDASSNSNPTNFIESQVLEGIAIYARLHSPDPGNTKMRIPAAYKIDLLLVDPKQLEKAKSLGLNIKPPHGEVHTHPYVLIKSKVKENRKPPKVIDSQRNAIPSSILVGNGSLVRVRFMPFTYGEGEVTAILQETQVLTLVRYESKPRDISSTDVSYLGAVEGGFVTEAPAF